MFALLLIALFPADPMPLDPTTGKLAIGQVGNLPTTYTYKICKFYSPGTSTPPDPRDTGYAEIDVVDENGKVVGAIIIKGNERLKDPKDGMIIKLPGTFRVTGITGLSRGKGDERPKQIPFLIPVTN
jgi:hypothetical protein